MNDEDNNGYGRPPKRTRFQKGRSGNPRGRPKGTKNMTTIIRQELEAPISVQENGRRRIMRRKEALIKGLMADALKGKDRPRKQVLDLAGQIERDEDHISDTAPDVHEDAEIIKRFLEREIARTESRNSSKEPSDDEKR
jgi:hypothetical protein